MWPISKEKIRFAVIMAYMVGNALTYNHVVAAGRENLAGSSDASYLVIKSLLISIIWPLYWLYRAFAG